MSDFKIDDIANLKDFATIVDELVSYWFTADAAGGCRAVPDVLVPDRNTLKPDIGQVAKSGNDFNQFHDAVDLYRSYDNSRRTLVGDPGQLQTDPTSSSMAAFVDGLNHLKATALAIYQNYDASLHDDKLSVDQISAMLNAPPAQAPPAQPPTTA